DKIFFYGMNTPRTDKVLAYWDWSWNHVMDHALPPAMGGHFDIVYPATSDRFDFIVTRISRG
ncbi:MAG: hypothetical protein V1918_01720, partial [Planctomycetota bacterium]